MFPFFRTPVSKSGLSIVTCKRVASVDCSIHEESVVSCTFDASVATQWILAVPCRSGQWWLRLLNPKERFHKRFAATVQILEPSSVDLTFTVLNTKFPEHTRGLDFERNPYSWSGMRWVLLRGVRCVANTNPGRLTKTILFNLRTEQAGHRR